MTSAGWYQLRLSPVLLVQKFLLEQLLDLQFEPITHATELVLERPGFSGQVITLLDNSSSHVAD